MTSRQENLIENYVRKQVRRSLKESHFNENDWLFTGITFDDLITAVESNEPDINESVINRVFNELMKSNLEDAKYDLKQKMPYLLKRLK